MRTLILLLTFLTSAAFADVVARPQVQSYPAAKSARLAARGSNVLLEPGLASWIYGSNSVPRMENLDRNYAIHPPQKVPACVTDWARIRRKTVNPVGVKAPLDVLEDSAERVGVSMDALHHALGVYLQNQTKIPNQKYISVVDYDKRGDQPRWFFFNLETGAVKAFKVSAGYGSDPDHDLMANNFSNVTGTNASSLGCSVSGESYNGAHSGSIRLHGIEESNWNNCDRSIVIHNTDGQYGAGTGRSNGCLAVESTGDRTIYQKVGRKKVAVGKEPGIASMLAGGGLVCNYKKAGTYKNIDKLSDAPKKKKKKKARKHRRRARRVQTSYYY